MKLTREKVYPWDNAITELLYEMTGNEDYLKGAQDFLQKLSDKRLLPSRYQVGDIVNVNFVQVGFVKDCKIIKVHFTHDKIFYDVAVNINATRITRLYNIDSVFVTKE